MTARQILPASADGTPEWLAQRTQGIGGTDMADLMLGKHTMRRIVAMKRGEITPEPISPELQALFDYGHEREPVLRRAAAKHFGRPFRNTGTWSHVDHPWMLANPDGIAAGALLEIKTTGPFTDAARDWKAGRVPQRAWVQAHWYAAVTGRPVLYFAAEVDRQPIFLGPYDVDRDLTAGLIARAADLWRAVETGVITDEDEPVADEVRPTFLPTDGQMVVDPWDTAVALVEKLRAVKADAKRLTDEARDLEGQIKDLMGDATDLRDVDGQQLATWSWSTRERFDRKAAEADGVDLTPYLTDQNIRTFRVKEVAA